MGKSTGLPRKITSERRPLAEAKKAAKKIKDKFVGARAIGQTADLGFFTKRHTAVTQGVFKPIVLNNKACRLEYEIKRI